MSGYKGYIVNNRKLYGFLNSYKAFIRIGDNVKIDYPKYKEKDVSILGKIGRTARAVLQLCSYVFVPQWGKNKELHDDR